MVGLWSPAQLAAQALDRPIGPISANLPEDQAAQPSRAVTGTLLDPSGAAIAGAQVSLVAAENKPLAQATTNNSGSFHFDHIAPGNYTLDFQAEGFRETRLDISVTTQRPSPIRVTMQIAVLNESVTVATGDSIPTISIENS